jgi:hypothetical protein
LGRQSESMITLPSWVPGEGSITLLERVHDEIPADPQSAEKEEQCWWILSALDNFDGKEAREKYYAGI